MSQVHSSSQGTKIVADRQWATSWKTSRFSHASKTKFYNSSIHLRHDDKRLFGLHLGENRNDPKLEMLSPLTFILALSAVEQTDIRIRFHQVLCGLSCAIMGLLVAYVSIGEINSKMTRMEGMRLTCSSELVVHRSC